jgi:hypothetical protein
VAKTVEAGFNEFLTKLTPTKGESEAAKGHRASVEACLDRNFGLYRFFRSGSFGNGTSISGYSDVDYFAWLKYENFSMDSSAILNKVRNALDARFPKTGIKIDSPAVIVPFGTDISETTEVVPAQYSPNTLKDYTVYKIADGLGGWLQSCPEAHTNFITKKDKRLKERLKPLIRFVKAWNYHQKAKISSFYLELRVADYVSDEIYSYSIEIEYFLKYLLRKELAAIQDPLRALVTS